MAMPQVDGWIPCTPLHPPLLSLSTLLPSGLWRHDVPFMVECLSVTCPQHCDQVCLHSFLIKEECGNLLSGWSHINKRNYIVLLIVQHSQDGSVDNININIYIFMKYQDVWFRCTLHDAQSCLQSFLDWKHRGSHFQILFWQVARAVWNEPLSAVTSLRSSSRTSCYCREVAQYCITSPHPLPSLAATLLLCTAVRSTLSGFQVSEAVTCSLSFCAWSVSFTTYGHLQLQLWHKYHYFFLFLRMNGISLCACMVFLYPLGLGRAVEFLCLSRLLCRVLHWEWKCSCLTTPPSFSLTASAE